jgi:ABC-type antimicrobial peptide transport system permease subunit
VRFYGLLKTIGTTPKQIRRIVTGQVMRLCVVGIPIGLILGALASFAISPLIALSSDIETEVITAFSPFIYIVTILFTLTTAYIGASAPSKKAAHITAIEAVRYTGEITIKNRANSLAHGKPYKMAFRNIFRERKRAVVVLLSLFMGVTIFIVAITFNSSLDVDKYVVSEVESDFILKNEAFYSRGDAIQVFDNDFFNSVQNLPGIDRIQPITQDILLADYMNASLVSSVNIDVTPGYDMQTFEFLKEITNGNYDISMISRMETHQSMADSKTNSFIMSGVMALIIGSIGIMNFINVMSVGVMARKREFAILESIGMSKKQLRQMLIYEGLGYGLITLVLAALLGNAIAYGNYLLLSNQWVFLTFTYPYMPVLIIGLIILLICIITPEIAYRGISKMTLVERLREAEIISLLCLFQFIA